jgi:hypothetical protein
MRASARIQVTLDVPVKDSWGDGSDIAQVRKQAIVSGLENLHEVLRTSGVRVIGEPTVTIVLINERDC